MFALRSGLVAVVLMGGLVGTASAQVFGGRSVVSNGYATAYPAYGVGSGYAGGGFGYSSGYAGYGGGYGSYGGYGNYGTTSFPPIYPQTYNNMGGLINTIRTQTGRPNSYRYGSSYGVANRRRSR